MLIFFGSHIFSYLVWPNHTCLPYWKEHVAASLCLFSLLHDAICREISLLKPDLGQPTAVLQDGLHFDCTPLVSYICTIRLLFTRRESSAPTHVRARERERLTTGRLFLELLNFYQVLCNNTSIYMFINNSDPRSSQWLLYGTDTCEALFPHGYFVCLMAPVKILASCRNIGCVFKFPFMVRLLSLLFAQMELTWTYQNLSF